ncbi:MAG: hypothetical protein IJ105_05090 [Bacilli bacterium]|nr:hypothetical protein [Bacilli bacterium]
MKKYLLGILILILGIFVITGCKDNKKTNTKKIKTTAVETTKKKKSNNKKVVKNKKEKKDTIVGNYEIIELKDDDEIYDKKTIDSLNLDYSFEVKDDNTAIIKIGDQEENLKYDKKYFKNEKEKIEYKYEKGKLVLIDDDTFLTFQKR